MCLHEFLIHAELDSVVRWYEIIALGGIVFAIAEFMEKNKFRFYVVHLTLLRGVIIWLFLGSIAAVIIATIAFAVNSCDPRKEVSCLLHYPATWEFLSLALITAVIILLLFFSLMPGIFRPRLTRRNCQRRFQALRALILEGSTTEEFSAIARIISYDLDRIFHYASKFDRFWNITGSTAESPYEQWGSPRKDRLLIDVSRALIDHLFSEEKFCNYIATHNIDFLLRILQNINKTELWQSCGQIFMQSLSTKLFLEPESHLSRELGYSGIGLSKPVFSSLCKSLELIAWYRPYQSISFSKPEILQPHVVKKYSVALEITLKEYYSEKRAPIMVASGSTAIGVALAQLSQLMESICVRIRDMNGTQIYYNQFSDLIFEIDCFFRVTLPGILSGSTGYDPHFSVEELDANESSVARGITDALFEYLGALSTLSHDEYTRHQSLSLHWVLFHECDDNCIKCTIAKGLLTLIEERLEENKKGYYRSMIKLLLNIYGFRFADGVSDNLLIGKYIEQEFKDNIAELILTDDQFRERHLPQSFTVDKRKKSIRDANGKKIYRRS